MNEKKGVIYKIKSPTGKIYIGQSGNIERRIKVYERLHCKNQIKLYNSLLKYGWVNHDFSIIEEVFIGDKKSIINEREIYWIEKFDSFKNGLNCNIGGNGNIGIIHSNETKKKISDTLKRKYESGEIITTTHSFTEEQKEKMSLISKEIFENDENHTFKKYNEPWNKGKKGVQVPWNKGLKGAQEAWNKGLTQPITEERREKLKGIEPWNKGKKGVQEAWNKGKETIKTECPHCGKLVDTGNGKRWHFDKCKLKENGI